jgi:predicted NBD/HSP70 family sugar kinase
MAYSLGIDIGSVNAKLALIDDHDNILLLDYEKVISTSSSAVASLLARLSRPFRVQPVP